MSEPSDVPNEVEVSWDPQGLTAVFPGAALTESDLRSAFAVLMGGTFVLLAVMQGLSLLTGGEWMTAEVVVATALGVPLLFIPFLALGWRRGVGTPIRVSIQPLGQVRYQWLNEDERVFAVRDLQGVQLLSGELVGVRLVLASAEVLEWRFRDVQHAAWMVEQLESAMAVTQVRSGQSSDVPEGLMAMNPPAAASE